MSVILITGQPGAGKTALAVDMLAHDDQFKGRPIFVMGIPDLNIEHSPCPPVSEWTENRLCPEDESKQLAYFTFPENSLVIIDEAQRIYRPRPVGSKVPNEVAAFETHRHLGIDFILLTQHAGLVDSNIRKLIGRHIHIRVTALGRYKYDWPELGDPDSVSSREIAAKEKYKLPKRAFELYTSSQKHTKIKSKLPWFVYLFAIAAVSTMALGYYAYTRVMQKAPANETTSQLTKKSDDAKPDGVITAEQYLAQSNPRLAYLVHTAPKYDEITKPNDAPWPVGCVINHNKKDACRCITQQGTHYLTSDSFCRQIVNHGLFKDWQSASDTMEQNDKASKRQTAQPNGVSKPLSVSNDEIT